MTEEHRIWLSMAESHLWAAMRDDAPSSLKQEQAAISALWYRLRLLLDEAGSLKDIQAYKKETK